MLIVVCLAATLTAPSVGDYFPTVPGTKWTYVESSDVKLEYTDEVLAPETVLGESTIPIVTRRKGEVLGTNFYQIGGDTVYLYAIRKDLALPTPQPFLKVGSGESSWTFSGQTPYGNGLLPAEFKGTTKPSGKVKFGDAEYDALKVVIDARIVEGGGLLTIKSHSEATYAKGIGMVEMSETVAYTKTKASRKVKLLSFEPPK